MLTFPKKEKKICKRRLTKIQAKRCVLVVQVVLKQVIEKLYLEVMKIDAHV